MMFRRALRRLLPQPLALAMRREWLAWRIVTGTAFEEHELVLLPKYVGPGDVCWDIGANSGMYTLPLARLASRVFAFEPVPHSFEILERVTRRARLRNVTMRPIAIADFEGASRMRIPTEGFYGGYYLAALDQQGSVQVTVSSIDSLIAAGVPEPDFIKCDVEGAEARVIEGARDLLRRRRPIWLLETFEDHVVAMMQSFGYRAHIHAGDGRLLPVEHRTPSSRNYLFLPQ
jgi:FkbM family methyltransferase